MSDLRKPTAREAALKDAMQTHEKSLLSKIRAQTRDVVEAEDIVQEAYQEFLEAYDVDTVFDSIGAWLYRVARNKLLDRFRRRKTEHQYIEKTVVASESVAASLDEPDTAWMSAFLQTEILAAIELLPAEQRETFVKHELEGLSFQEISEQTGVSVNTLLSRKRYALIFLRKQLKETYDELE